MMQPNSIEIPLTLSDYGKIMQELPEDKRGIILQQMNEQMAFAMSCKHEPIIEFKDEAQAYECLKEWQSRLFLDDWIIMTTLVGPGEARADGERMQGTNEYQVPNKCALIKIEKLTDDTRKRIVKCSHEVTLVHELLHCKFVFTDGVSNTTEGEFMGALEHQLIEDMAKSLIMAKYGLDFSWFKNF